TVRPPARLDPGPGVFQAPPGPLCQLTRVMYHRGYPWSIDQGRDSKAFSAPPGRMLSSDQPRAARPVRVREGQGGTIPAKKREVPGVVEQLREAIRGSGQSLSQLGKACGVDATRLSRFVRGERDLTLSAVEKICRVLGL